MGGHCGIDWGEVELRRLPKGTLTMAERFEPATASGSWGFVPRRLPQDTDIDMTPVIDVTFQLLIFFMFAGALVRQEIVELPPAEHGVGVDVQGSVLVTLGEPTSPGQRAPVFLGDPLGLAIGNLEELRRHIASEVAAGKTDVIVRAARGVPYRDIYEVGRVIASVKGARLHVAVREKEE
jgi:biopolymer transport protein ExbD